MSHIHTEPGQHDITMSAYIVRIEDGQPKVLVHMHRKHHMLLQIGGHIELNETPWQTVAREVKEESGYDLSELEVLQPDAEMLQAEGVVMHPVPVFVSTYKITGDHYHSDLGYAFVAKGAPHEVVGEDESADLRWLTLDELADEVTAGHAAKDAALLYKTIVSRYLNTYHHISAVRYSLAKPEGFSI